MDWIRPNISRPPSVPLLAVDKAYVFIGDVFAFLNLFGCLVIFYFYIRYKTIRTTSRLLVLCLSVANVSVSFSTILQSMTYYRTVWHPDERSFICQGAAGLLVFSQIATALWTVTVTLYLFLCVTVRIITVANRLMIFFHLISWIMPMIVAISADLSGVFGYDSSDLFRYQHPTTCWLSDRVANPLPWYLITVEGWVMAAYVIGSLLYFPILWTSLRSKKYLLRESEDEDDVIEQLAVQTANEHLRFIPVIYVCTRLWGTGYFLFTRYPDDRHLRAYDWLLIFKVIGDNSQGWINAILFCMTTKHLRKTFCRSLERCWVCFFGWCRENRFIGNEKWMRVPKIVRARPTLQRKRTLDGSDLDISGISLELPTSHIDEETIEMDTEEEDEVLFESSRK